MTSHIESSKFSILDYLLSLSGIAAPVFLLCSVLVASILSPGYSHVSQAISELGARGAPFDIVLNYIGLIPAGILTISFSIVLFRKSHRGGALLICSCLVTVAGIGRLCAGVFPCDPGCFPIITITGKVHALSGLLSLFSGSIAPLFMAFALRARHSRSLFYASLILGVAAIILFIILISQYWMFYFGAIQRLLLIVTYTWIIFVAVSIGFGKTTYAFVDTK
jgi:hypothetical membrane protein